MLIASQPSIVFYKYCIHPRIRMLPLISWCNTVEYVSRCTCMTLLIIKVYKTTERLMLQSIRTFGYIVDVGYDNDEM